MGERSEEGGGTDMGELLQGRRVRQAGGDICPPLRGQRGGNPEQTRAHTHTPTHPHSHTPTHLHSFSTKGQLCSLTACPRLIVPSHVGIPSHLLTFLLSTFYLHTSSLPVYRGTAPWLRQSVSQLSLSRFASETQRWLRLSGSVNAGGMLTPYAGKQVIT